MMYLVLADSLRLHFCFPDRLCRHAPSPNMKRDTIHVVSQDKKDAQTFTQPAKGL